MSLDYLFSGRAECFEGSKPILDLGGSTLRHTPKIWVHIQPATLAGCNMFLISHEP
jgi:hypothetical protein